MNLVTMTELHSYIKDTIIDSLTDGIFVYTDHRFRPDGTSYDCSSFERPAAHSAPRLHARADLFDWSYYPDGSTLSDFTRRLCDILCDEVTGRLYLAWYPSGVFAGRFYRAYLSEASADDITIQDYALAQNISVEQASAEYYNPAAGDESPKIKPLIVHYIGEFFEDIAREAVCAKEPILTFKAMRNVTNL